MIDSLTHSLNPLWPGWEGSMTITCLDRYWIGWVMNNVDVIIINEWELE